MREIKLVSLKRLRSNPHNAKTHSKKQIRKIADSIEAFGFTVPVLIDEEAMLIAGHGRLEAAKLLGLETIPAIFLEGLSDAKKRAVLLADNKIAESSGWDRERLAIELPALAEILVHEELHISITGFEPVEVDQLVSDFEEDTSDAADAIQDEWASANSVSQKGDLWQLGKHRLLCGDARDVISLDRLMDSQQADMVFVDPPYNVRIASVVGRGRSKHAEFDMASGEMSRPEFVDFLKEALGNLARLSRNGAIHFVCMDWRHIGELMEVADETYTSTLNLAVWVKANAGQGSLYRSQHELIGVFRAGDAPHLNNVELGRHGRSRSNVWHYSGTSGFKAGRTDELRMHPTVKPVMLVADAMKDCTRRNDVVVDTFCGSGTTVLAAERVGRRAYAMEIEPRYVDVTIRRWQIFIGRDAIHAVTGQTFDDLEQERNATVLTDQLAKS